MPEADAYPLLPSLGSRASSRPGSRTPSRPSSRQSSRPASRGGSRDPSLSELEAGRGSSRQGSSRVLFKAPEDSHLSDDDDEGNHDQAPLLSREDRTVGRPSLENEIESFADALGDGPAARATGTLLDGIANMANSILGAGIIGLPYAIRQAGFVTGITLLIVLAVVTDWTIRLVVINAKLSGRDSYIDVMAHTFGRAGAGAVSFFQFAFAFGGMCAFNVIIGDSLPQVIAFVFPFLKEHAGLKLLVDRRFIIVLCTITVAFPLSLHRDIVKLSKSSGFALVSMGVIVCSVVFRSVGVDPSLKGSPVGAISLIRGGVFEAIGVISFAFVCHHNTMFIYKSISVPTLDRFNAVTHTSTSLSLVCCLLMSVTGYLTFTDKTEGNILNNFAADDWVINIARFCFGANMSTTIPLENYVCREVLEDCFWRGKPFSRTRHVASTCAIVFSAMFISLLTCDLGVVLEIAGGLSATALAFIFPAGAFFALTRGPWNSKQRLPAVVCVIFGTIVLLMSTGIAVSKAMRGEVSQKKCD
ncbi:hypothetical protein CspeluHIS016_0104130 [Cutaneotrichosporon spelunceum]|uniref:Amino acid transporter transmembrane domain-containing protein n=1 Tax=Cutaneotrichosporon spelunceum TaxID=1672016 RepID=A0AAD3Y9I1_9TREE|nr:hypothetical protein CspeluHIS016_0104130 [Cutaneotrichosporon spelunceum]